MNILKTMVFPTDFMKKVIMICPNLEALNEFIKRNKKHLEENEKFLIETHFIKDFQTFYLYITDEK